MEGFLIKWISLLKAIPLTKQIEIQEMSMLIGKNILRYINIYIRTMTRNIKMNFIINRQILIITKSERTYIINRINKKSFNKGNQVQIIIIWSKILSSIKVKGKQKEQEEITMITKSKLLRLKLQQ